MLIKNIEFSGHKNPNFISKRMSPDLLQGVHHLKAEIESFKMVCNMPLGLF